MKRLILCCDGTWNTADHEDHGEPCPSNVVKIAFRVAKRDGDSPQIIYYDQGVGTGNSLDKVTGGAFGEGLEANVQDAYRFLVANYELGDQIFLFGFSRGAFTARSIAGMIRKCGILRREYVEHYRDAIGLYQNHDVGPDDPEPVQFRTNFALCGPDTTPIKFIGVWDTVGALGIPLRGLRYLTRRDFQFHDTELSKTVEFAYHALAIDEHRAPFAPTLWNYVPKPGQTVEQVWFCGVHSDIGGGYPECGSSDLALGWMLEKAHGAGLILDGSVMQAHRLHPDEHANLHNSKTGLYWPTPGIDRVIGITTNPAGPDEGKLAIDPTQSLHPSVLARWDGDPTYRPKSLGDYFTLSENPRAISK